MLPTDIGMMLYSVAGLYLPTGLSEGSPRKDEDSGGGKEYNIPGYPSLRGPKSEYCNRMFIAAEAIWYK
jgi:hypothetical protein